MPKYLSSALITGALILSPLLSAEEVTVQHNNLTLNANLELAEENGFSKVVLITHGTLAHNGMEIISGLQELLLDEDISSLAINLSLGQDNRHGMYDCSQPHSHKHTDAVTEIEQWVHWLKAKGSEQIILAAHSRGGNQTAWYADESPDSTVAAQVLLAPQTWTEQEEADGYAKRYGQPLAPLLQQASQLKPEQTMQGINFIYCENTDVLASSFTSYYQPDNRLDTPTLLQQAKIPTLVISGSEDTTVPGLAERMQSVQNPNVRNIEIEGAGHFFRDLYLDEVIENTLEFLDEI